MYRLYWKPKRYAPCPVRYAVLGLGGRLAVGLWTLAPSTEVRILAPQPANRFSSLNFLLTRPVEVCINSSTPFELNPYRKGFVEKEEKPTRTRYGIVNFEKRRYPRFNVDLPVEYSRSSLFVKHGRAVNISEGGLLLYLPERAEIGQQLVLKLFFPSGTALETIETLVQVVWTDIYLGEDWGDYRTGVSFADISSEDLDKLMNFLRSLSLP